jgi:hypothetical protein
MEKKYVVKLSEEERVELNKMVSNGNTAAKKYKIAQVLLRADVSAEGLCYTDQEICDEVEVSVRTVMRLRQRFVEGGLAEIFRKRFTPRYSRRKFDGEKEAQLIALCCSNPPAGRSRWTLRLLADKVVECKVTDKVSYETIRETLKKTNLSLG